MSSACDFLFHNNRNGGSDSFATWSPIPYPGSQPCLLLQENGAFLSFLYVCPEPVLVK
eukprot:COSAG06_NODE_4888_length_3880_cov_3.336683_3_plen_58_part_00